MTDDKHAQRLSGWMFVIALQVADLCGSLKKFAELEAAVDNADMYFIAKWYTAWALVVVRRLVDEGKGVVSFVRLLGELQRRPELLRRERFIEVFLKSLRDAPAYFTRRRPDTKVAETAARRAFDELVGKQEISRGAIEADKRALKAKCKHFQDWADQWVAHVGDPEAPHRVTCEFPDRETLEDCVRYLEEMTDKYSRLLGLFPFTPNHSLVHAVRD